MQNAGFNRGISLVGVAVLLVIGGLIVGAVLVGKHSLRVSEAIGTLAELDKYEAATHAFKDKYSYLPGDIPAALVAQLKFTERSGMQGRGDGNGIVEGYSFSQARMEGAVQTGEPFFFWEDLYSANLIKEAFDTATDAEPGKEITDTLDLYIPDAHMKESNHIYVYSANKINYYGLSSVMKIGGEDGMLTSHPGMTTNDAYDIDSKMDDGIATTGKVVAKYVNETVQNAPCFDNASGKYLLSSGQRTNCALSFQMN